MKKTIPILVAAMLLVASGILWSQEPIDADIQEEVAVNLVQVDALVMGKDGQTVPDLTKDDFELRIGGKVLEISTFDVDCSIGAVGDPLPIKGKQVPQKLAPGMKRKIVFAFDYYFLAQNMRAQIVEAAASMLDAFKTEEEEVMIVALAWGVRVEQRFSSDKRQLVATLQRMEHDVTLWGREYTLGATGQGYFDDMTTLMDVLEGYDGPKAVVLFSQATSINVVARDTLFNNVAMHAAASRSVIYPSNPDLLLASGRASDALSRFANQSGGRMPFFTGDVSVPYRWAQRDLSCRYTVGAYLDPEEGRKRQSIRLSVKHPDAQLRHPEMIKLFTDDEIKEMRTRAAFVEPGPYEHPLVRAFAFPAYPANAKSWETLLVLNLPMPVEDGPSDPLVRAELRRNSTRIDKYKNQFTIDPPEGGGDTRPVTLVGDAQLKEGRHSLNVVLSKPEGEEIVSAEAKFDVPPVLSDLLILRGPLLARVVPGGLVIPTDSKDKLDDTRLERTIGSGASFEPLLVHQIDAGEELLSYWTACVQGESQLEGDAVITRRFMNEEGELVHELESMPLDLKSQGKKLVCHDNLEKLPANALVPGEYEYEVSIAYTNGDLISRSQVPLMVE